MAKKGKGKRAAGLMRWARRTKTKNIAKALTKKFGKERARRVAVGLRAKALGITIRQLAKRGRKARKKGKKGR